MVNFISGEYEGAIKGVSVDLPLSNFQFLIESRRCRKVFFWYKESSCPKEKRFRVRNNNKI